MFEQFRQYLFQNLDYIVTIVFFLAFVRLLIILPYLATTTIRSAFRRENKPDFITFFHALPSEAQDRFIHSLNMQDQLIFQDTLYQQFHQREMAERFNQWAMHENQQFHQQQTQQAMFEQFNEWAMLEGIKSVTPFDHGGYVQGYGFNPSDTLRDFIDTRQHQMDNHHHNNYHSHS